MLTSPFQVDFILEIMPLRHISGEAVQGKEKKFMLREKVDHYTLCRILFKRFSPEQLLLLAVFVLLNSCVSYNQLLNYQGEVPNPEHIEIKNPPDIRIQPNDIVSIKVHSSDVETAAPFNLSSPEESSGFLNVESMQLNGYMLDREGAIDFPILGRLVLQGLSITEAKEMINEKLKQHLKDPVVNIRLLNFTVSVTGEVQNPGTFTIINERISLPDALALAGDLTGHANRSNILLVRESNGERALHRVNLQSAEFFQSELYYLKQNDLIYVEPIRAKAGEVDDQTSKTVPIIGVAVSLMAVIIALVN